MFRIALAIVSKRLQVTVVGITNLEKLVAALAGRNLNSVVDTIFKDAIG